MAQQVKILGLMGRALAPRAWGRRAEVHALVPQAGQVELPHLALGPTSSQVGTAGTEEPGAQVQVEVVVRPGQMGMVVQEVLLMAGKMVEVVEVDVMGAQPAGLLQGMEVVREGIIA